MTATAQPSVRIKTNRVFEFLRRSKKRVKSLRGGTRSGKTYNTCLYFVVKLLSEPSAKPKVLTIARQTMPALRASVMRDFFDVLDLFGIYDANLHNKTNNEYTLNGHLVEFIGLSEDRRVRGRKRDYLFINEANEVTLEAFRQLALRTAEEIVLDYNPSEPFSWIYDDVESRDDCDLLVTTYRDNPFLERSIVSEIERLKDADEDYWKVYGLGQIGAGSSRVYQHWRIVKDADWPEGKGERVFGLDFGYNNPSALVEVILYDETLYWKEMLYQPKLTNPDLIARMKEVPVSVDVPIIADSAEPARIEEINRNGLRCEPAYKIVKDGIDFVKSKQLRIHENSENLIREIKRYSWKKDPKTEKLLDEVVKFDDHCLDAARYGSASFREPVFEVTDREMEAFAGISL